MRTSHVIEFAGTFAGAAVETSGQFRFVAVHPYVERLDGKVWPSLFDMRRAVGHMMIIGRTPIRKAENAVVASA